MNRGDARIVADPQLTGPQSTVELGNLHTLADHQRLKGYAQEQRDWREKQRLTSPYVRLYDGDFNLRGVVEGERVLEFEFKENDVGTANLQLSLDHYLAKWIMDYRDRFKRNVHMVIDKQGARWSGRLAEFSVIKDEYGDMYLDCTFLDDMEQLKHIVVYANPFLPAEVAQFPKAWVIAGPAKWCLLSTLFVNLWRIESSVWTLPDNPLDPSEWTFPAAVWTGNWRHVIKPFQFLSDKTPTTLAFSRFKTFFDMAKPILDECELTMTYRRYLPGDPHPFSDLAGAMDVDWIERLNALTPIRYGAVVWDIEDHGGYDKVTSFGGSLGLGLTRAVRKITSDGTTENVEIYKGEPTYPGEYYNPWWKGSYPEAPWVIFNEGPLTGIKSSEFKYVEAKAVSYLTGGSSAPGLNEGISAAVNAGGDILSSLINSALEAASGAPVGAIPVEFPPLGGIIDAVAKLLYWDTFAAFHNVPTLRAASLPQPIAGLEGKQSSLGDFHLAETWCEGADKAFTMSAMIAVRSKMHAERQRTEHVIEISDGAPYMVGQAPYGHFFLGSRVGVNVFGYPDPDAVFVERVTRISYMRDKDGPSGWKIELGNKEERDPMAHAFQRIREVNQLASQLGLW